VRRPARSNRAVSARALLYDTRLLCSVSSCVIPRRAASLTARAPIAPSDPAPVRMTTRCRSVQPGSERTDQLPSVNHAASRLPHPKSHGRLSAVAIRRNDVYVVWLYFFSCLNLHNGQLRGDRSPSPASVKPGTGPPSRSPDDSEEGTRSAFMLAHEPAAGTPRKKDNSR
jgi:hypothetical protein